RLIIDEQNLALAALQGVGGDAVVLHELVEGLAGDAAELGARHAEALELPVVEATDDGLLGDLADFRGLAGREHGLHTNATLPARPAREKEVRRGTATEPAADRNPSVNRSLPGPWPHGGHRMAHGAAQEGKVVGSSAPGECESGVSWRRSTTHVHLTRG